MAKTIEVYEADGVTLAAASYDEGTIRDGAASTPRMLVFKNTSTADETLVNCRFTIVPSGANDGDEYLQMAADDDGIPGAWGNAHILVGDLPVNTLIPLWVRFSAPAGTSQIGNPRAASVRLEEA